MDLKPDIVSIFMEFRDHLQVTIYGGVPHLKKTIHFLYYNLRIS